MKVPRQPHQPRRATATLIGVAVAAASAVLVAAPPSQAAVAGGPVLALTATNTLVGFDAANPGTITRTTSITGLQPGESVVGVDIRPATGELFAVAIAGTTGRMYVIDTSSGAARPVGSGAFSTTLPAGGTWSVDFNPTVDRIRFVHSGGTNLRLNPLTGTLAATDTPIAPGTASALAYDRSTSPAPTATTLFAIDADADSLGLVGGLDGTPSPNGGATSNIGALGVAAGTSVGFDIAPQGDALATLSVGGSSGLYTVDLATGAATLIGAVGDGSTEIRDLALPRPPVAPMVALDGTNRLIRFSSATPGTVTPVAISGLRPSETIVGIDVRPATGELIAVGFVGAEGRVYRLDPASGAATPLGPTFTVAVASPAWSVDFNPTVDRIRLISASGANYRVNPITGALAATDTAVAPATIGAAAYDRSLATSTATTLYAIDPVADALVLIGGPDGVPSPNGGATTLRGALGVDATRAGFDISPVGEAVAALRVGGVSGLYAIDLVAGTARPLGTVGDGSTELIDVAFAAALPAGASQFVPVSPTRLLDTRAGQKPTPGSTTELQVAGVAGVPADATAVVVNVTGTEATAPGFVTLFPTGTARPDVSNHNLALGETRANLATVKVGTGGKVSIYTLAGAHVIVDVLGFYAAPTSTAGRYTPLAPARLVDTRETTELPPGGTVVVPVLGRAGVPATGVSAVLVNLAGTDSKAPGYLTAYATGSTRPATSNLNLERAGKTASNLAIVPVGPDGSITVYSLAGADVIVDVSGWFSDTTSRGGASGLFVPLAPSRVLDTRTGVGALAGALAPEATITVTLAGAGGVPAFGASGVLANITAVDAIRPGYVTAYPAGTPLTTVSSINVDDVDRVTPNLVAATLGTAGAVSLYDSAGGHLLADVAGWYIR